MLFLNTTKDEDIIKVYNHTIIQDIKEYMISDALKGTGRIHKPHGYYQILKYVISTREPCFRHTKSFHGDLMISVPQIQPQKALFSF